MRLEKTLHTGDKSFSFLVSTEADLNSRRVVLSVIHPVLANAGFSVLEEENRSLYISDLRHCGVSRDLATLPDDAFKIVMAELDARVHDFYFAFYPKVMAVELHGGFRLQATRLGMPVADNRRFSKRTRYGR